jgi:hypothetical protein
MTDRHLSNRFERGTRERRLLRSFETGLSDEFINDVALIDINTQHDMLLVCHREDGYAVWIMEDDPEAYEDSIY